jgi:hypothetical protein
MGVVVESLPAATFEQARSCLRAHEQRSAEGKRDRGLLMRELHAVVSVCVCVCCMQR